MVDGVFENMLHHNHVFVARFQYPFLFEQMLQNTRR